MKIRMVALPLFIVLSPKIPGSICLPVACFR
ncbi:hypothetical protein V2J09_000605 [Rumex salicifolius]